MSTPERLAFYLEKLDALVFAAERDGVQLTAETVSLPPLAMGRHYTKTDVRPMHKLHGPPLVREQVEPAEQIDDICECGYSRGVHGGVTNCCPRNVAGRTFTLAKDAS